MDAVSLAHRTTAAVHDGAFIACALASAAHALRFDCAGHPGETDVGNFVLQPVAARKLKVRWERAVEWTSRQSSVSGDLVFFFRPHKKSDFRNLHRRSCCAMFAA